jgi:hypothetical protein
MSRGEYEVVHQQRSYIVLGFGRIRITCGCTGRSVFTKYDRGRSRTLVPDANAATARIKPAPVARAFRTIENFRTPSCFSPRIGKGFVAVVPPEVASLADKGTPKAELSRMMQNEDRDTAVAITSLSQLRQTLITKPLELSLFAPRLRASRS